AVRVERWTLMLSPPVTLIVAALYVALVALTFASPWTRRLLLSVTLLLRVRLWPVPATLWAVMPWTDEAAKSRLSAPGLTRMLEPATEMMAASLLASKATSRMPPDRVELTVSRVRSSSCSNQSGDARRRGCCFFWPPNSFLILFIAIASQTE